MGRRCRTSVCVPEAFIGNGWMSTVDQESSGQLFSFKAHIAGPCICSLCYTKTRAKERRARSGSSTQRYSLSLEAAVGAQLLVRGLEAAVAELGRRVDELELDLLQCVTAGLGQQRAAQRDGALDGAGDGALCEKKGKEKASQSTKTEKGGGEGTTEASQVCITVLRGAFVTRIRSANGTDTAAGR